jgi:hypothetical protein
MLVTLFVCVSFLCLSLSSGYQRNGLLSSLRSSRKVTTAQHMASYEEMMEQATLKKQQRTGSLPPRKVPAAAPATTIPGYNPPKVSTGGLPFNDAQYDDLKYIIEKLTRKIKSDVSLTPEELIKFENAVEAVIADAGVGGEPREPLRQSLQQLQKQPSLPQPSQPHPSQLLKPLQPLKPSPKPVAKETTKYVSNADQWGSRYFSGSSPDGDNVSEPVIAVANIVLTDDVAARDKQLFDTSFGKFGSSWQFEGMDEIDNPDDFYKAINKRSAAIRQLRSKYASRESAEDYQKSLSRKKE